MSKKPEFPTQPTASDLNSGVSLVGDRVEQSITWNVFASHELLPNTSLIVRAGDYRKQLLSEPAHWETMVREFEKVRKPMDALNWLNHHGLLAERCIHMTELIQSAMGIAWLNKIIDSWLSDTAQDTKVLLSYLHITNSDTDPTLVSDEEHISKMLEDLGVPTDLATISTFQKYLSLQPFERKSSFKNESQESRSLLQKIENLASSSFSLWSISAPGVRLWLPKPNVPPYAKYGSASQIAPGQCNELVVDELKTRYYKGNLTTDISKDESRIRLMYSIFFLSFFRKAFENIRLQPAIELVKPDRFVYTIKQEVTCPLDCMYLYLFQKLMNASVARTCKYVGCNRIFFAKGKGDYCPRALGRNCRQDALEYRKKMKAGGKTNDQR